MISANIMRRLLTDVIIEALKEKFEDPDNVTRIDNGTVQVRSPSNPPRYFNIKVSEKF